MCRARFVVLFWFIFCLCSFLHFFFLWFYNSVPRLVFIFSPRFFTLPACVSRTYLACLSPFQAKLSHLFLPSFPRVFSAPSLCLSPTISSFLFHFPRKSLRITAFSPPRLSSFSAPFIYGPSLRLYSAIPSSIPSSLWPGIRHAHHPTNTTTTASLTLPVEMPKISVGGQGWGSVGCWVFP